jgi:very-short-patch-repair endonuclease
MRDDHKIKEARELRKNSTWAEAKIWEYVRNRQVGGFKFIRQATIGPFIADFLCREKKLVVELDGWTHSTDDEIAYDARRTRYLEMQGFRVLRFTNEDCTQATEGVLDTLLTELKK